ADSKPLKQDLHELLQPNQSPQELFNRASHAMAELTHMAGVVAIPKREVTTLRQVEFLPLSEGRVLVVLVVNRAEVQNRIIHLERDYAEHELREAANYINHHYAGCRLSDIRTHMLQACAPSVCICRNCCKRALMLPKKRWCKTTPKQVIMWCLAKLIYWVWLKATIWRKCVNYFRHFHVSTIFSICLSAA